MPRRLGLLLAILLLCPCLAVGQSTAAPSTNSSAGDTTVATAPPTPVSALTEAEQLYRAGKFRDAMRNYEQAVKLDAKRATAREGLVRSYLKLDMVQEAWDTAQEGLKQAPEQSLTHTAMGEVLFRKGYVGPAQDEFVAAHNMNPKDARARLGLARVYRSASYYAQARKMLEAAHSIDSQDRDIANAWAATRPRKERLAALEQSLAKETDKEGRERAEKVLDFLKAAETQPHACQLAKKLTETEVQLKVLMPNPNTMVGVKLKVTINGKNMDLLLDTGASGVLLRRTPARKAGVVSAFDTKISGVGDEGAIKGYVGYADSIKVGALEFQGCLVEVADTRNREGRDVLGDIDGLIGADVFSGYLISIDFPGERMTLKPLPKPPGQAAADTASLITASEVSDEDNAAAHDRYVAPEMAGYTPFFRFGHDMLIPTKIGNAEPKLFLIDSGAMSSSVSPKVAREVTLLGIELNLRVEGVSGEVKKTSSASRVVLQFGHIAQENLGMIAFDTSDLSRKAGIEISGFLGYSALAFVQMDIDYRDGLVNFTYDPKKYRPLIRGRH